MGADLTAPRQLSALVHSVCCALSVQPHTHTTDVWKDIATTTTLAPGVRSVRAALGARLADVSASRLADVAALEGAAVEVDRALEAERSARREQRSAADSQASAHRRAEALRAEVDAAQRLRARQMELTARAAVELRSARRSLEEVAAVREGAVATQAASWRHSRTLSNDANVFETEVVSWYPRATLFRNFISAAERAHIEALVSGHLSRSQVVSDDEDKSVDRARTSSGVFLVDRELRDEVVMAIEERIANATHTPRHNGEGMVRASLSSAHPSSHLIFSPTEDWLIPTSPLCSTTCATSMTSSTSHTLITASSFRPRARKLAPTWRPAASSSCGAARSAARAHARLGCGVWTLWGL